jgi:microcystin-dependent protein
MSRVLDLWAGMTGTVLPFAGATAPTGWLLCHGQAVSRTQFPNLFAAIGTTYGAGDGSTTFGLPDLRGRVVAGKDDMGGTAAGRLTNTGTGNPGINGSAMGAAGGTDRHTLTLAQMPAHTHDVTNAASTGSGGTPNKATVDGSNGAQPTAATQGSGQAHPNTQPTIVLNSIIKT